MHPKAFVKGEITNFCSAGYLGDCPPCTPQGAGGNDYDISGFHTLFFIQQISSLFTDQL
jgi:hypothetical protein